MDKKRSRKMKVAIIGTNGLPAKYGGFETLTDKLTKELNNNFDFYVYCRKTNKKERLKNFNNSKLIYLPFKANGAQSTIYDAVSMFHAWFTCDILLILGPAAGVILPLNFIFRKKIIVNHGGLNEWERTKYSWIVRKYIKFCHKVAAKSADHNLTDNIQLKINIKKLANQNSVVIRYGGDHVKKVKKNQDFIQKYPILKESYAISVSRAQEDNNLHILLEAFAEIKNLKLILISNWQISKYGRELKKKYSGKENVVLLDAIYDDKELNLLRSNALLYIHSHSQCGTAPSLVEAMCLNLPIVSYDVPTNRETTHNKALYFKNKDDLVKQINQLDQTTLSNVRNQLNLISDKHYRWNYISQQYSNLFLN